MAEQEAKDSSAFPDRLPAKPYLVSAAFPAEKVVPLLIGATVDEVERELVLQTLVHCHGNRTRAASVLGVSIRTLRNKIKEYAAQGLVVPPPGEKQTGSDSNSKPGRC
jgi:DNA-binding NtrC family response regulator